MNILYHHRSLADGAEGIHIHEMTEALRGLGHRVTIQSLARPEGAGQRHSARLATVRRRMPQAVFELAAAAINIHEYAALRRQLAAERFDLIYKRHALLDVGAILAARRAGIPVALEVNTAYSAPSVREFEPVRLLPLVRRAERLALRSASVVLAVSSPLAAYVRELAGPAVRVLTLANGVNPEFFDASRADGAAIRAAYGLTDQFVVGWAGILRRWHGIEVLIDAVATLPAVRLLLIGDGPARPDLERLAEERGLRGRLTVTGRVPHAAMPSHIAALDVAIAADDRTGFASPMKVLEYMGMARPVVLPRLANLADLVHDDRTGLFFEPGSAASLALAIGRLQASPPLRARLGRAARLMVEDRFNWSFNARAVLDAVATPPRSGACL